MKKFFKRTLVVFLLLLFIVASFEYLLYRMNRSTYPTLTHISYFQHFKYFDNIFEDIFINLYRPVENAKSKESPIIIFGCSYAFGDDLDKSETFSHKLAKYTNSPIYNFAMGGFGVQHMYYELNNAEMQNRYLKNMKEPKYVFYVYVPVQNIRLYNHVFIPFETNDYLQYDIKTLKRVIYPKIFYHSFILKNLDILIASKKQNNLRLNEKYLVKYFSASKEIMEKKWKHTKYYILFMGENQYNDFVKDVANKSGWNYVILDDMIDGHILDSKYVISETDRHPNGHLWDVLCPKIAEKLDL